MKTYLSPMLWFDLYVGSEDLLTVSTPTVFGVRDDGEIADEMDFIRKS